MTDDPFEFQTAGTQLPSTPTPAVQHYASDDAAARDAVFHMLLPSAESLQRVRDLPWARWPQRRCQARREDRGDASRYFGRCELRPHGPDIDHALKRGGDTPRWSTEWTG